MEICVKKDEDKAKEYIKKREKYILRSNHTEATDTEIWDIYNTIRKVEDSFKTMKTDLRLRPIFHQKEEYTKAHIFLTVLAYHVVNIVLYKLRKKNENIRWTTFLEDMATQTIGTLNFEEINKKKNSIRVVDQPTERQSKLYEKLQITAEISPNKKLF
jgi:transposase